MIDIIFKYYKYTQNIVLVIIIILIVISCVLEKDRRDQIYIASPDIPAVSQPNDEDTALYEPGSLSAKINVMVEPYESFRLLVQTLSIFGTICAAAYLYFSKESLTRFCGITIFELNIGKSTILTKLRNILLLFIILSTILLIFEVYWVLLVVLALEIIFAFTLMICATSEKKNVYEIAIDYSKQIFELNHIEKKTWWIKITGFLPASLQNSKKTSVISENRQNNLINGLRDEIIYDNLNPQKIMFLESFIHILYENDKHDKTELLMGDIVAWLLRLNLFNFKDFLQKFLNVNGDFDYKVYKLLLISRYVFEQMPAEEQELPFFNTCKSAFNNNIPEYAYLMKITCDILKDTQINTEWFEKWFNKMDEKHPMSYQSIEVPYAKVIKAVLPNCTNQLKKIEGKIQVYLAKKKDSKEAVH